MSEFLRVRGGLVGLLVAVLKKANRHRPITREEMRRELLKAYPELDPERVWLFLASQVPTRLKKVRGYKVMRNSKYPRGYWIERRKHRAD